MSEEPIEEPIEVPEHTEHEDMSCMTCCNKELCTQWLGTNDPTVPTPCIGYSVHCNNIVLETWPDIPKTPIKMTKLEEKTDGNSDSSDH